jgi:hypothetical protein
MHWNSTHLVDKKQIKKKKMIHKIKTGKKQLEGEESKIKKKTENKDSIHCQK